MRKKCRLFDQNRWNREHQEPRDAEDEEQGKSERHPGAAAGTTMAARTLPTDTRGTIGVNRHSFVTWKAPRPVISTFPALWTSAPNAARIATPAATVQPLQGAA